MKVVYNAIPLIPPLSGIGVYSKKISEEIALLDGVESVQYFIRGNCGKLADMISLEPSCPVEDKPPSIAGKGRLVVSIPLNRRILHGLLLRYSREEIVNALRHYLPRFSVPLTLPIHLIEDYRRDRSVGDFVYHETNFVLKPHRGPKVVTVHDLSVFRYPEFHPKDRVEFMSRGMKRSMDKADQIITVSEYVKLELLEKFSLDDSKVTAIPHAADASYKPRDENECLSVLTKYGLSYRRFLLVVGSVEPRKNLSLLFDVYQDLPEDIKNQFPIVHVGPEGWNNSEIGAKADCLADSNWFRSLGYVDQLDLPFIFSSAAGLAFPSVYEGFGLPALEAMASGTPVLSSNVSAIPEVVASTGLLVDPYSHGEMLSGLEKLLQGGAEIDTMVCAALARGKDFSWNRAARETFEVYSRAGNSQ